MCESHIIPSVDKVAEFVTAGNATFTIENTETGNRFTYRVRTPKEQQSHSKVPFFVGLLNGSDNTTDYQYLGQFWQIDGKLTSFVRGKKSRVTDKAVSVKAIAWIVEHLVRGNQLPTPVRVWHEGRCGRCGRVLTVPSSIESGIGPECAKRIGGES